MGYAYTRECDRFQAGCLQTDLKKLTCGNLKFIPENFREFGFQVFSQWDEDGLIQYLISHIEIENKVFVEFGVENYEESNTKFLLMHDDWRGLVMDSSVDHINYLKRCSIYWKHSITALEAFITPDNINALIRDNGIEGDIGLLSIDIDGNDFYVWEAITCIRPRIVICEVNPYFGAEEALVIPYQEDFNRTEAHYSNLYWGASLRAFQNLADKKGYRLVCINSAGTNAFFVRSDVMGGLKEVDVRDAWKAPLFRESRDENGKLTYLDYHQGLQLISDMELKDITSDEVKKISACRFYKASGMQGVK